MFHIRLKCFRTIIKFSFLNRSFLFILILLGSIDISRIFAHIIPNKKISPGISLNGKIEIIREIEDLFNIYIITDV